MFEKFQQHDLHTCGRKSVVADSAKQQQNGCNAKHVFT